MVRMKLRRKLGKKGQVVVPKDIREDRNLHPNDEVYFSIEDDKVILETGDKKLSEVLSQISNKSEGETKSSRQYHDQEIEKRLKRAGIE